MRIEIESTPSDSERFQPGNSPDSVVQRMLSVGGINNMILRNRAGLSVILLWIGCFLGVPGQACVSLSSASFSAVSAVGFTLHWNSVCSTASLTYTQIDEDPGFFSPVSQSLGGPPALFGSLTPNTLYYAQVATNSFMMGSVALGSTRTWANPPGALSPTALSSQEIKAEWGANANPAGTLFESQISSNGFSTVLLSTLTPSVSMTWGGLLPETFYDFRVRAFNSDGLGTSFVDLGSTRTLATPFIAGGSSATIQSPDGAVIVTIASGTFLEDYRLFLTTDPVGAPLGSAEIPAHITEAQEKLSVQSEGVRYAIPESLSEIRAQNALGLPPDTNNGNAVKVSVSYASVDGETVDGGGGPVVRTRSLAVYRLNEEKRVWVRLPNSQVDAGARSVTAWAPSVGVFSLVGQLDTSLETAYAYPVPFLEKRGDTTITFSDLAQRATLRIFSVSGRWIQTLEETDGDGELVWNVHDADGDPVPSGVYFYLLESSADKKRGKLVIVRNAP